MNAHMDVANLLPAWMQFRQLTDIAPIRNEAHYQRMVATLEALLEVAGSDESHPAMELVDVVGDLVEDYEAAHHTLPQAQGREALAFLMAQRLFTQDANVRNVKAFFSLKRAKFVTTVSLQKGGG